MYNKYMEKLIELLGDIDLNGVKITGANLIILCVITAIFLFLVILRFIFFGVTIHKAKEMKLVGKYKRYLKLNEVEVADNRKRIYRSKKPISLKVDLYNPNNYILKSMMVPQYTKKGSIGSKLLTVLLWILLVLSFAFFACSLVLLCLVYFYEGYQEPNFTGIMLDFYKVLINVNFCYCMFLLFVFTVFLLIIDWRQKRFLNKLTYTYLAKINNDLMKESFEPLIIDLDKEDDR